LGFEDDDAVVKLKNTDANGLLWEQFNTASQDEEIVRVFGTRDGVSRRSERDSTDLH
jgi:hypothetical protein